MLQSLRPIGRDQFSFALEKRDERIDAYKKYMAKNKSWLLEIRWLILSSYGQILLLANGSNARASLAKESFLCYLST